MPFGVFHRHDCASKTTFVLCLCDSMNISLLKEKLPPAMDQCRAELEVRGGEMIVHALLLLAIRHSVQLEIGNSEMDVEM